MDCEKEWRRNWRNNNKDKEKERFKQWAKKNKDYLAIKDRAYRIKNKEILTTKQKIYRENNSEKIKEYTKQWTSKNLDKKAANESKRRAIKANAPIVEHINREEIIKRDRSTCHICGKKVPTKDITLDHIIPLSKGGAHAKNNIAVAHSYCNYSKSDKLLPVQLAILDEKIVLVQ